MAIIWDENLPQNFLQQGYSEGTPDNLIVSSMNTGPAKRRPKSTEGQLPVSGQMHLTLTQKLIFDTFYNTTIAFGALALQCLPTMREF